MIKRLPRTAMLSIALLALLLAAVGGIAAQDDEVTLVIGFEQEPPNLRPLNSLTFGGYVQNFYARELWEWDRNRDIVPVMVEEIPTFENGMAFETEEGDTAVTITLREGLQWSDGTPITSADCELNHILKSDRSTSGAMPRGQYPELVKSFEIVDERTFIITYDGPFPDYLTKDPERPTCRFPAHVFGPMIEDGGVLEDDPYFTGGRDFDGARTVGYGPYVMTEWNIGEGITYERNEFWQGPEPAIDRVIVRFITDDTQMRNALEVGEIDLSFNWSDDLQPEYAAIDAVETFNVPGVYTDALWMRIGEQGTIEGTGSVAMQDPLVRQAMVHAIDRRTLAEELVGPGIRPMKSWYPEQLWPEDLPFLEYDVELANQLLDEAGWVYANEGDEFRSKDGVELSGLRFVTTENTLRNNYQLVIQEYLAEVGVGVDIQIIPATVLFASFVDRGTLTNFEWDLAIFANSADPLSPLSDADSYYCSGIPSAESPDGFNGWQFCNPRYDEVDQLIQSTFPGPERDALIEEAVMLFHEGYFWHGLRERPTWVAVDTTSLDAASVEANLGTLADDLFNQIENWQLP